MEAVLEVLDESLDTTPAPPRLLKILRTEDESNGDNMREGSPPRANDLAEAINTMALTQTSYAKVSEKQAVQNAESMRALFKAMEMMVQQQATQAAQQTTSNQSLARAMEMTVQQQAQPKSKLNGFATPLLTAAAIVVTMFGVSFIPASTSSMREDLRMANYKIEQSEKR